MANIDFIGFLNYGIVGLGCALAILTYFLLRSEQAVTRPRPNLLKSIKQFMYFSLGLCVLGIGAQSLGLESTGKEPRPFAPGHPGNVIGPELKSIEQAAVFRRDFKCQFAFSDMIPGTPRAKFKLVIEFVILNASDKMLDYKLITSFDVPAEFAAIKVPGRLVVRSEQGETEVDEGFKFERDAKDKNSFAYSRMIKIPAGQSKLLQWQTLEEIEAEMPYKDYLFSVNPTDTMEITVSAGSTKLKPKIVLQRSNTAGSVLEEIAPGVYSFKASGPFLPYQGVEFVFSVPGS